MIQWDYRLLSSLFSRRWGSGFGFLAWTYHLFLQLHRQCARTRRIKDHHVLSRHGELVAASLRAHRHIQQDGQEKKHLPGQQPEKTLNPLQTRDCLRSRNLAFYTWLFGRHESSFFSVRALLEQSGPIWLCLV